MTAIAILGEYTPASAPQATTTVAIGHAQARLGVAVEAAWISTAAIDGRLFERFDAVWIAPGSPYKNLEATLWAIRRAREAGMPCFGTCGGFQHMVLEYARNVLGFRDAQHAEYDPYASRLFVTQLACSLVGREMRLRFAAGSRVAAMYGALDATEEYYCNFGVNPEYVPLLGGGPLRMTGTDAEGEARVIELPGHPFFLGTLFVPQTRSTSAHPHPLVSAFVEAAVACTKVRNA
jgi:CTP synthase (UTP-ammonia lyase)